uniref:Uncharacterized protein n=1 Tax=Scophthalmus maximus TaxID=52904 RepID=A0A8D3B887_SCOMX
GEMWGEAWVRMRPTRLVLKRGKVKSARATTPPMEWPTSTTLWGGFFRYVDCASIVTGCKSECITTLYDVIF